MKKILIAFVVTFSLALLACPPAKCPPAGDTTPGWADPKFDPATCRSESKHELCWDGVDNNCNGVIDEGCPVGDQPSLFVDGGR